MRSYGFTRKALVPLASAIALASATGGGAWAAPKETVLYAFKGGNDGVGPYGGGPTVDGHGNIYGTTQLGGGTGCGGGGCGVVFRVAPDGTETVLHEFVGGDHDGGNPSSTLIIDKDGNLFGVAQVGGGTGCGGSGCGVVFKLEPPSGSATKWTFSLLHPFTGGSDGGDPSEGALVADKEGNLYGATTFGGAIKAKVCAPQSQFDFAGCGVVFKVARDGAYSVLYTFEQTRDGNGPNANLVFDAKGNLYGTTAQGGLDTHCPAGGFYPGCGVVFELTPPSGSATSWTEKVLYTFTGLTDGAAPLAGPLIDAQGNLYGTTDAGGNDQDCVNGALTAGCGTVWKLSPGGLLTTLHTFTGGSDGGFPGSSLIADCKGNLYGTAADGGAHGLGVVFKILPNGAFSVLYSFKGGKDGANPLEDPLTADSAGNIYGVTQFGGPTNNGTVFKLTDTGFVTGSACSS